MNIHPFPIWHTIFRIFAHNIFPFTLLRYGISESSSLDNYILFSVLSVPLWHIRFYAFTRTSSTGTLTLCCTVCAVTPKTMSPMNR